MLSDFMHKEIKLFHAQYHFDYSDDSDLGFFKMILDNAQKHGIYITSQQADFEIDIIAQEIVDALADGKSYSFTIQKGELNAKVVFIHDSIKLYLQPPFAKRMHVDELEPSVDYLAYLNLLLDMLANVYVHLIETNEELRNN